MSTHRELRRTALQGKRPTCATDIVKAGTEIRTETYSGCRSDWLAALSAGCRFSAMFVTTTIVSKK
jgi:hypothetical protein